MHFATTATIFALAVLVVTLSPTGAHPADTVDLTMAEPTAAPTRKDLCDSDDESYLYNNDYRKSCEWVLNDLSKRCKLKDPITKLRVKRHCPSSCNQRCSCVDTTEAFYVRATMEWAKCGEVRKSDCNKKIKLKNRKKKRLSEACPLKCSLCYT